MMDPSIIFSDHPQDYARFRPHYPQELVDYIISFVPVRESAWDCGTGNGQMAGMLATVFDNVFATDISRSQLDYAIQKENIHYSRQPAEHTSFANAQFNLVTVAQAIHWFQFDAFYSEVKRTLKPGGIFAVTGYGLLQTNGPLQQVIEDFYKKTVGPYWHKERVYIDEAYQTIPFPFDEIKTNQFSMTYQWSIEQLTGYLDTWSAVKQYQQQHNRNPVDMAKDLLVSNWGEASARIFSFPLLLRIGRS